MGKRIRVRMTDKKESKDLGVCEQNCMQVISRQREMMSRKLQEDVAHGCRSGSVYLLRRKKMSVVCKITGFRKFIIRPKSELKEKKKLASSTVLEGRRL